MTLPGPKRLEREREEYFLSEAALLRRLGLDRRRALPVIRGLQDKGGFPRPDRLFGKYYWPSVKSWLDRHNGINPQAGRL